MTTPLARLPLGPWVALGGGVGATARFLLGAWLTTTAASTFPWSTFAVNLSGSALLGFLFRALPAPAAPASLRAFLMIGLCGGFTTFSTFDLETFTLLRDGRQATALLYSASSVLCCIAGIYGGFAVAAVLSGHRRRL